MPKDQNSLPLRYIKLETQEVDELAQHIKHADVELIQTSGSQSPSSLRLITFDNIDLQVGKYGASSISNTSLSKEKHGIVVKSEGDYQTICNSYDIDSKHFMFQAKNSEQITINKGPCSWAYITVKSEYIEESLLHPSNTRNLDVSNGKASLLQCNQQIYLEKLYREINGIVEQLDLDPNTSNNKETMIGMELDLIDSQILLFDNSLESPIGNRQKTKATHMSIIKKSSKFLESNYYKPVHVIDLCGALDLRPRSFYYAFQEFYGMSPMRYLKMLRYAKTRRQLINADPSSTTVTDIASYWHFWHYGRFSVEYKSIFGESPSQTLRKMS